MSHMVIFRTAEGKPGYHQSENLDEAVRFVEHLRNSENVPDARIFRMQEVPIEFKTYVRVEVAGMDEAPAPVAPAAAAPVAAAPVAAAPVAAGPAAVAPVGAAGAPMAPTVVDKSDDVVVDPMPAGAGGGPGGAGPGGANNRFGRFNRG